MKRLTKKVYTYEDGTSEYFCGASFRETNNCLGELEDKIESGQLVENKSYRVREENGYFVITQYRVSQKYICSELSKEAAERRLAELKGEGKN